MMLGMFSLIILQTLPYDILCHMILTNEEKINYYLSINEPYENFMQNNIYFLFGSNYYFYNK
jgi:hypothetical protein